MSMALVMSKMPDVWRKVLAEHVPDGAQHCRECRNGGGQASWPCQTYRIAQEAKWVAEGNLPGTGPHGPGLSASPYMSPPEPTRRPEPAYRASDPGSNALWGAPSSPSWADDHPSTDSLPSTGSWPGPTTSTSYPLSDALSGSWTGSYPSTDSSPSTGTSSGGFRPLAGDPLGTPYPEPAMTSGRPGGEQPYGSTFDAPYGASFGVDDHPHAARY